MGEGKLSAFLHFSYLIPPFYLRTEKRWRGALKGQLHTYAHAHIQTALAGDDTSLYTHAPTHRWVALLLFLCYSDVYRSDVGFGGRS